METTRTVQTAFRFTPDLVERLKKRARRERTSVNAYVEKVLEKDLGTDEDRYEALYREIAKTHIKIDIPNSKKSQSGYARNFGYTDEELAQDPKLEYLVNKYGK